MIPLDSFSSQVPPVAPSSCQSSLPTQYAVSGPKARVEYAVVHSCQHPLVIHPLSPNLNHTSFYETPYWVQSTPWVTLSPSKTTKIQARVSSHSGRGHDNPSTSDQHHRHHSPSTSPLLPVGPPLDSLMHHLSIAQLLYTASELPFGISLSHHPSSK